MGSNMDFGQALVQAKAGSKIARKGWNGKGMFVVYQKGYPDGIPCNKQTADAWGMDEGESFRCEPYLQIQMVNGSHSMWVPSINDTLAEDWEVVLPWKEIIPEGFGKYRKKGVQLMREYIPGEDLTGISVSDQDTPEEGGMIAINLDNPDDKWYIAKEFFQKNYERV